MEREKMLNLSMFALRLIVGTIFLMHGAQKFFGTFNGIGLEGVAKMAESMGFSHPYIVAISWACIEFVGGIFLVLGILARWSAAAIILTVLVYMWKISLAYGFSVQNGDIEYNLLMIGACIPLVLIGGGKWSVWDM